MALTIDYLPDGRVAEWSLTPDGVDRTTRESFTPTLYVGDAVGDLYGRRGGPSPDLPKYGSTSDTGGDRGRGDAGGDRGRGDTGGDRDRGDAGGSSDDLSPALRDLRAFLDGQQAVAALGTDRWRQTWRTDERMLLRIDVRQLSDVRSVANRIQGFGEPGAYTCYNVDFTRQLRYCLETGTPAGPDREVRDLRSLELAFPTHESGVESLPQLRVEDERVGSTPRAVVETVSDIVAARDPDVLVLNTADIVPLLFEAAESYGLANANADSRSESDFQLGRRPGYTKLASASTYTSYGRVGHSPARYAVPGRVIIDESNSFFYHESGLAGCLDLVERSGLPLQELGWASIGRVLTAMQIREARSRDVLVPWHAWRPEFFKSAATLDNADRGGTTLAPEVGLHEDVHELDFASLYPNIIREKNISPETICCGCCDTVDVPTLGYSICDRDGYLPDVLGPLIDGREDLKARIRETDDPAERDRLEAASSAIKWILVSCFGYQGFSNAKFGRIECHEAINAYAREILLDAKDALEEGGWHVLHGIVDSIWVTPADGREQRPLKAIAAEVSDETGIRLEYEAAFDWVAFCPRRDSAAGALTRYFGKRAGEDLPAESDLGDAIKTRGIEVRQRSTPAWVADIQRDALRVLDRTRDPRAVCDRLDRHLRELRDGDVDPTRLVVDNRVSKEADAYTHETLTVAALKRAELQGSGLAPGQSVRYVVVRADGRGVDRVRLAHESPSDYDADWYERAALRALESVVAPLGWRSDAIEEYLADRVNESLTGYGVGG